MIPKEKTASIPPTPLLHSVCFSPVSPTLIPLVAVPPFPWMHHVPCCPDLVRVCPAVRRRPVRPNVQVTPSESLRARVAAPVMLDVQRRWSIGCQWSIRCWLNGIFSICMSTENTSWKIKEETDKPLETQERL